MVLTHLERALLAWAREQEYVGGGERVYGPQLIAEQKALARLEGNPFSENLDIDDNVPINHPILGSEELIPDISRFVYTPTGVVSYHSYLRTEGTLPSNRSVKGALERELETRGNPFEVVHFVHGPFIPQWKSLELPLSDRVRNHVIYITFHCPPERDFIVAREDFTFQFSPDLTLNQDPLYQFIGNMLGNDERVEENIPEIYFVNRLAAMAALYPKLGRVDSRGRKLSQGIIEKAKEMYGGDDWLPKNEHAYALILKLFSKFIEGTAANE